MKKFFLTVLAVVVGGIILSILPMLLLAGVMAAVSGSETTAVKPNTVLFYNLQKPVIDRATDDPQQMIMGALRGIESGFGLNQIVENIDKAATDPNIVGIVLEGAKMGASFAQSAEIRDALAKFKESGKFIYFYDGEVYQSALYVASVADKIMVAPQGMVELSGVQGTSMFFKGLIDKFDIGVEILRHGKFKSAVEPFMLDKMSDASREQMQKVVDSQWANLRDAIAEGRNIDAKSIDDYVDNNLTFGPVTNALEANLVDSLIYRDQFLDMLKAQLGVDPDDDIESIGMEKYTNAIVETDKPAFADDKIAVIYAQGDILNGSNKQDINNIYGDNLSQTIRKARRDDDVKAIVLRVNSPGGSASASDLIWREVKLASATKPVVVSMGTYAASGGYYISCAANYIFADASTLTGSIGVFGMFPYFDKTSEKIGVTTDIVHSNKAPQYNYFVHLTDDQRAAAQQGVEYVYSTFVNRCAEGRKMTFEQIDSIGQGRVWTGADAIKIGLVDEIGTLGDAIAKAKELANVGDEYEIKEMPEVPSPFDSMMKQMGMGTKAFVGKMLFGESYDKLTKLENMAEKPGIYALPEVMFDIKW